LKGERVRNFRDGEVMVRVASAEAENYAISSLHSNEQSEYRTVRSESPRKTRTFNLTTQNTIMPFLCIIPISMQKTRGILAFYYTI
jgi:uncharacterized protein (UPF0248 family)